MAKNPAFQFYAQDFLIDTLGWPEAHVGRWCRIMSYLWINGPVKLEELNNAFPGAKEIFELYNSKFIQYENGTVSSKRLEKTREDNKKFKEKQSKNGSKGGRPTKPKNNPDESQIETQNKSQKKPLEEEDEVEEEIELVKDKELEYPFPSEEFFKNWNRWKKYKLVEFNFQYKSKMSEQAGLTHLGKISGNDERAAEAIIERSMANGWEGLFEIKNGKHGSNGSKTQQTIDRFKKYSWNKDSTVRQADSKAV